MRPEALRERDLNRYYQPYLNATTLNHVSALGQHVPTYSNDRALTAFAQLAALRLNTKRVAISLIDSQWQYILTEATQTLSLSRHTVDTVDDKLIFGNVTIPRKEGLCENVFGSTYTAVDEDGVTMTAEGLVVTDCTQWEITKHRSFVIAGPKVRFYAGVPIKSRSGHTIGVYATSDGSVRHGLTVAEFRFMHDVAEAVMDHLEMIRDKDDRFKGERMVRGLAEFIDGSSAMSSTSQDKNDTTSSISSVLARQTKSLRSMTAEDDNHDNNSSHQEEIGDKAAEEEEDEEEEQVQQEKDDESHPLSLIESRTRLPGPNNSRKVKSDMPKITNPNSIFYRASDLIRKSTFADGVVFFRAVGLGVRSKIPEHLSSDENSVEDSTSASSDNGSPLQVPSDPNSQSHIHAAKQHSRSLLKDKFGVNKTKKSKVEPSSEPQKFCEVIGLSISENAPDEERLCASEFLFSEGSMEYYLRKFPHGKFFSFTETGSGVSSGDDKSEVENDVLERNSPQSDPVQKKSRSKTFIPTEILRSLPSIRTLIFLPLWDPVAERWIAGAFLWTSSAGSLMSPQNELPYLKAFGNSITSEYARVNALIADRAKSDFISSISHELRSPLHGILGSVEFLAETEINNHQRALIGSVETCSKTLLETLEHILDYAKINKLNSRDKSNKRLESKSKKTESSIMGPVRDDVDFNQIVEEVSESVCAGHAFKETHNPAPFMDTTKPNGNCNLKHVSVSLEISPKLPFLVRTQPGAIRRIAMNLLGNALKYTQNGFIAVKLSADKSSSSSRTDIKMIFRDSGKGMTIEYQRTRLFSPFSQEDPFADGTGLGLSIVRQIVDSLGGHIDIKSQKDVGTVVEVHLSLPHLETKRSENFPEIRKYCSGKRIGLLCDLSIETHLEECVGSIKANAKEWYNVEVENQTLQDIIKNPPDAIICFENYKDFRELNAISEVPLIIVCKNQTNQVSFRKSLVDVCPDSLSGDLKIVAQPLSPAKFGRALKHIWSRHESKVSSPLVMYGDSLPSPKTPNQSSPVMLNIIRARSIADPIAPEENEPEKAMTEPSLTSSSKDSKTSPPAKRPIPMRLRSGLVERNIKFSQHHILCVEDNLVNMRLLTMFMRKFNLPFCSANNGLEAFEKYKLNSKGSSTTTATTSTRSIESVLSTAATTTTTSPSFSSSSSSSSSSFQSAEKSLTCKPFTYVLMDISMPVMDGLESTRRIRAFERETNAQKAIIIALTGLASEEAQRQALDAGVDFYLAKPVKFVDLQKLMEI